MGDENDGVADRELLKDTAEEIHLINTWPNNKTKCRKYSKLNVKNCTYTRIDDKFRNNNNRKEYCNRRYSKRANS